MTLSPYLSAPTLQSLFIVTVNIDKQLNTHPATSRNFIIFSGELINSSQGSSLAIAATAAQTIKKNTLSEKSVNYAMGGHVSHDHYLIKTFMSSVLSNHFFSRLFVSVCVSSLPEYITRDSRSIICQNRVYNNGDLMRFNMSRMFCFLF